MKRDVLKKGFDAFTSLLVSAAAVVFLWTQFQAPRAAGRTPPSQPPIERVDGLAISASSLRNVKGTGRVALVEFTDYECPFCGRFTRETAPLIDRQLVATGQVRRVVFNFPLERIHPQARKAGEATECAARQGRFWEMYEGLFAGDARLATPELMRLSDSIALDGVEFERCLATAPDAVTSDLAEGRRLGVSSTPTFFVGLMQPDGSIALATRINGAAPYAEFAGVLGAALTGRQAAR